MVTSPHNNKSTKTLKLLQDLDHTLDGALEILRELQTQFPNSAPGPPKNHPTALHPQSGFNSSFGV